jgi:glycerol-3-phosphate dehydrogenase
MNADVSTTTFDLIIIGAGINGAGIARDAAMRGLKVLVLDKGDVGSGTSSWSTRLIHGGLRYLEHGEFGLVRESLREREILLRIASHLVQPIPILIPIYQDGGRGRLTIRAGMIAYDLLSSSKSLPHHQMLSRAETLHRCPGLEPEDLIGGAIYYDCQVEFAERLVLENILSSKEHRAEVLTYARVTKVGDGIVEFVTRGTDEVNTARAQVVVNASGPWVDTLAQDSERLIGGTKGSHIVVRPFAGSPSLAIYVEAEADRRPFFVIPWNNNYLIGTTDNRFEGDLDQVRSELWEVDYLLTETNRVFPEAHLQPADVCYTYSGVRPLPLTTNSDERRITRQHFIREHHKDKKLLSIVGGKLTTYRSLAEECVDLVFRKLNRQSPRCLTAEAGLPGAAELVSFEAVTPSPFSYAIAKRLSHIYGAKASELVRRCNAQPDLARVFNKAGDAIAAEIVFAFEVEGAVTLADCLLRRTMLGLNPDLAIGDDVLAAEIAKQYLGWSEEREKDEVAEYRSEIERMRVGSLTG